MGEQRGDTVGLHGLGPGAHGLFPPLTDSGLPAGQFPEVVPEDH